MRDPYRTEPGAPPEVIPSAVAFLDLLGYSERIRSAQDSAAANAELASLKEALDNAGHWVKEESSFGDRSHRTRFFTDCLVIAEPIHEGLGEGESELGGLFSSLALFQLEMILRGVFVRGAIAAGPIFVDDQLIFGLGLLEAVEAEKRLARDPRIILTDSAAHRVRKHLTWYASPDRAPQNSALLKDADGQVFINYLSETILMAVDESGPFLNELERHRDQICSALDRYTASPRIWSKYLWCANYHMRTCTPSHPEASMR